MDTAVAITFSEQISSFPRIILLHFSRGSTMQCDYVSEATFDVFNSIY